MGYENRVRLYGELEEKRHCPVIAYVTSIRPGMSAQMAQDAIPYIIEQVDAVDPGDKEIDFLIVSNGGDPIVAQRIISILRERFDRISVLVPYVAFSAATILALGADKIIMHPYSNLGPVDPQLTVTRPNQQGLQSSIEFSTEDIKSYIDFVKNDFGISDQLSLIRAFESLASEVGAIPMGSSKRSQQLSLSLSEKMLATHMDDKSQAASIAQALNSSFFHHGYAVSREEAKEIGLEVEVPESDIEKILWGIWSDFNEEMKCSQPFDPTAEAIQQSGEPAALCSIPAVQVPAGLPVEAAQAIALNQIRVTDQATTRYECVLACIESARSRRVISNRFFTAAWRDAGMNYVSNTTVVPGGWE